DKRVNNRLLDPTTGHERAYLVQVEGEITTEALEALRKGLELSIDGKSFITRPAKAEIIEEMPEIPERVPPVRFRKNIPTSWIRLSLVEGKNRQVRKMTAKVGFPTLRLIRESIHEFSMKAMVPGAIENVERAVFYAKLGLR
ncbi:MAG: pseudouridine synthase, partial [Bacteroidota bacterium]